MAKLLIRVFLVVGVLLRVSPVFADSIFLGEQIVNGDFQTDTGKLSLEGWAFSGASIVQAQNKAINTATGNKGFNSFFSSAFAALGDTKGDIQSTDENAGTSSISQTFELSSTLNNSTIERYDIDISFSSVFDGRDANSDTTKKPLPDYFSVVLTGITVGGDSFKKELLVEDSLSFLSDFSDENSANLQLENDPYTISILGLETGTYTLSFILFEDDGKKERYTNTAVGIDDVSVMATAYFDPVVIGESLEEPLSPLNVVPEPSTILLLGGGLALLPLFRRRQLRN